MTRRGSAVCAIAVAPDLRVRRVAQPPAAVGASAEASDSEVRRYDRSATGADPHRGALASRVHVAHLLRIVRRGTGCAALAALVLGLAGCQAPGRVAAAPEVPRGSNAELVAFIADQPFVTAEPAYRAVYVLWKGEPFSGDFDALAETLRAGGVACKYCRPAADQPLRRGMIAFMVCRACEIHGGVNWALTGMGRYAWRELQHRGIAGPGSEYGWMSGGEFVGLLLRAEDHPRQIRGTTTATIELGSPTP